jgi:hypothetical protein
MSSTNTPEQARQMLRDLYRQMDASATTGEPVVIPEPPDGVAWDLTGVDLPFDAQPFPAEPQQAPRSLGISP